MANAAGNGVFRPLSGRARDGGGGGKSQLRTAAQFTQRLQDGRRAGGRGFAGRVRPAGRATGGFRSVFARPAWPNAGRCAGADLAQCLRDRRKRKRRPRGRRRS